MTTVTHGSRSAEIHQRLDHPVVDGDAHWLESVPVFHDYVKAMGGPAHAGRVHRVASCRRPLVPRLTPAAIIQTVVPQEAIDEAEHVVKTLGLKVGLLHGVIQRPIPADEAWQPDPAKRRHYYDPLGLDSPYDYDPLWVKLVELRLAYTSHSGTLGDTTTRSSPTSVVYSRVGHFAQAHQMALKGLLMGGVMHRFPLLNFAFLEAAWPGP
jgi:predicted TIM-barrel fold metal-dependent hydrolase